MSSIPLPLRLEIFPPLVEHILGIYERDLFRTFNIGQDRVRITGAIAAIGSGRLSLSADKRETGALPPDAEDAGESEGLFRSVSLIQNGADSAQQGFSRKGLLQKVQPRA